MYLTTLFVQSLTCQASALSCAGFGCACLSWRQVMALEISTPVSKTASGWMVLCKEAPSLGNSKFTSITNDGSHMVLVGTMSIGPRSLGWEAHSLIRINGFHTVNQTELQWSDCCTITEGLKVMQHAHRGMGTKLLSWNATLQMATGFSDRAF